MSKFTNRQAIVLLVTVGLFFEGSSRLFARSRSLPVGSYELAGTHSKQGPYSGKLIVKADGQVQRMISFVVSENETVQELWEGRRDESGIHFNIRPSYVVTQANGYTLEAVDFKVRKIDIDGAQAEFVLPGDGSYQESYSLVAFDPGPDLFDPQKREKIETYGNSTSHLIRLARLLGIDEVIRRYRALPFFDPYRDRQEFRKNESWQYRDFTDLEFYRSNRGILRLRNLSLNPLAIAEARARRQAFASTLYQKAVFKDERMAKIHLNDVGILEHAIIDRDGKLVRNVHDYDSALWTAMYAWSQLLRYRQTQDHAAYEQFKKAVTGIANLMSVSSDPRFFARYLVKSSADESPQKLGDGRLLQGRGNFEGYKFHPSSNNDMSKGILLGFLLAHEGLEPSDSDLRRRFAELLGRVIAADAIAESDFNRPMAQGLLALWTKTPAALSDFVAGTTNLTNRFGDLLHTNGGFLIGAIEDSSGIHLNLVSSAIQLLIARALEETPEFLEDRPRLEEVEKQAENQLRDLSRRMEKARHGFIEVAAYALTGDESLRDKAVENVSILKEVPISSPLDDMEAELSLQPDWCPSSWPHRPWKALHGPLRLAENRVADLDEQEMGAYGYPLFEGPAWEAAYLWKNNYSAPRHVARRERADVSADFLWLYWLSRSANLIGPND